MTTEQKVIRAKVGVLELARQLGNVNQAYRVMGLQPGQLLPFHRRTRQRLVANLPRFGGHPSKVDNTEIGGPDVRPKTT